MALIKCTECGKEFSDKATACPNCGCPTEAILENNSSIEELASSEANDEGDNKTVPTDLTNESKTESENAKKPANKKTDIIVAGVICAIAIIAVVAFFVTKNSRDYAKAQELLNNRNYVEAEAIFAELGDYEDSAELVNECKYQEGNVAFTSENFEEALKIFEGIQDYNDSEDWVEKCNYELTVDGKFMRALSKGLMARWDKNDEYEENGEVGEDPDRYREFCQIELDQVEQFYDQTFDNTELQDDARQYIDYLKEAQEATKQYTVNYSAYSDKWGKVYANRTILLQKMISEYGLTVDEEHQDTLDDLMVDAEAVAANNKVKADVDEMCQSFEITVKKDEWGYKTFGLKMKNTTDLTFEYFYVDANVVDAKGSIITTGSGGNLESWKPGVEANADFWIDDQDVELDNYNVEFTPHYSSGSYYE